MPEMILLNPRRRKRRASPAAATATRRKRRRVTRSGRKVHGPSLLQFRDYRSRHPNANPRRRRRRRNPIGTGGGSRVSTGNIMSMLREAALGGAGALAADILMGQINPMLPPSLQTDPTTVGAGDVVKAGITATLGLMLSRATKGASKRMAIGALTTQVRDILSLNLPSTMTLGWTGPAKMIRGQARIGPNVMRQQPQLRSYMPGARAPLLNSYMRQGGQSPLLSSGSRVASREGIRYR